MRKVSRTAATMRRRAARGLMPAKTRGMWGGGGGGSETRNRRAVADKLECLQELTCTILLSRNTTYRTLYCAEIHRKLTRNKSG